MADLLAGPQVRRQGRRTKKSATSPGFIERRCRRHCRTDFRAKGDLFVFVDECHRTQSGELHEAMKAILPERDVHRLHRHAAAQGRQAEEHRDLRPLHPHLQVRRGRAGRRRARPALRGARHRPEHHLAGEDRPVVRGQDQGPDRPGQGPAQAALGHDAEGALQPVAAGEDRRRHPDGHGDPRPAARAAAATPCWSPAASTRPASSTSCSPRPTSRASAPSSPPTSRQPADIKGEESGEGDDREAAASTTSTGRCWPTASTSRRRRR